MFMKGTKYMYNVKSRFSKQCLEEKKMKKKGKLVLLSSNTNTCLSFWL